MNRILFIPANLLILVLLVRLAAPLKQHRQLSELLDEKGKSISLIGENLSAGQQGKLNESLPVQAQLVGPTGFYGDNKFKLQEDIFTAEQFAMYEQIIYNRFDLQNQLSLSQLGYMGIILKAIAAPYNDLQTHHYEDYSDLRNSGGPHVDQELCLRQLNYILENLKVEEKKKMNSTRLELQQLMDSFGRAPSGLMQGNFIWLGNYNECLNTKKLLLPKSLEEPDKLEYVPFRYCIGSLRDTSWPNKKPFDRLIVMKAAGCLPKTCDSLNYKNKYSLIRQIGDFNGRDIDKGFGEISELYCLPDEQSALRQWYKAPKTAATVLALGSWLVFLLYCTWMYAKLSSRNRKGGSSAAAAAAASDELGQESKQFGMTRGLSNEKLLETKSAETRYLELYKSLSIINNLKLLFDTTKESSLMQAGDKLKEAEGARRRSLIELVKAKYPKIIDLNSLEGIKVICMTYVVMGHVLMCISTIVMNGYEFANAQSLPFYLANLAPAFAVNSFFTITGILTSFLLLKQNKEQNFMTSPLKWVAFFVYRYMRIMPIYILVVLYAKYLAKFAGSGPFWDYATSSMGHRRTCEQESWWWVILFGANFKSPLKHCVVSAWYLANDFQFFLVTPFFLILLHKTPKFGQTFIKLCILAGYLAGFASIYLTELQDLRPIASFMAHGFNTYVHFLHSNYARPQYRIPAYLCGLLFGYALYTYEDRKLRYFKTVEARRRLEEEQKELSTEDSELEEFHTEPDWSEGFLKYGSIISFLSIAFCIANPVIASNIRFTKFMARISVALAMPLYHILFSVATGIYILLASTGHGNQTINRLLGASIWKPLARLSLCVVLINMDVISFIIQTMHTTQHVDTFYHLSLNVCSILITYLLSTVVCVLFEAPLRAFLNHLLTFVISKVAESKRRERKQNLAAENLATKEETKKEV